MRVSEAGTPINIELIIADVNAFKIYFLSDFWQR